jgi:spoIIIJ-associated protein
MKSKEFSAKTTEEAVRLASDHFKLPLGRLKVEVINAGSNGILGLFGKKKAKILVTPTETNSTSMEVQEVMRELTGEEQAQTQVANNAHENNDIKTSHAPDQGSQTEEVKTAPQPETAEVTEAARKVLARLVDPLDPDANIISETTQYSIELKIDSQEIGILIGRRGQTLEALQYLTTRIVSHQEGRPVRINVDAGDYRKRRVESLQELAARMASKARSTRRPVAIGPFNAQERRIVHLALRNERGLSTSSRGRGEVKKVIISPRY